jgi:hypothetical protein
MTLAKGQIQRRRVELGQPLQVAAAQAVGRLVAVAVGGEPTLGQPLQQLGRV